MKSRSRDWNQDLAKRLRGNAEFAREYLLALIEDGMELKEAFSEFVSAYGLKEYAAKAKLTSAQLLHSLRTKSITDTTYKRLLKPLKLKLTLS